MIDYTGRTNIIDADTEELGQMSQNCNQCDNYSITIRKLLAATDDLPAGAIHVRENVISESNDYILEPDDVAVMERVGISHYLDDWAATWAANEDDTLVERIKWGLLDPDDAAYTGDGPCNVIVIGCYFGYTPVDLARDAQGESLTFETRATAQAWIDAQQEGIYYTSHNEAGRPSYIIVEA